MDYSKTVQLPQTEFPMKARLAEREPERLEEWEREGLYRKLQEQGKAEGRELFVLHDGPPLCQRPHPHRHSPQQDVKGHGGPLQVDGRLSRPLRARLGHPRPAHRVAARAGAGKRREREEVLDFREACREYALRYVDIQREEFRASASGATGTARTSRSTPSTRRARSKCSARWRSKGHIYKGLKPVYWCATCETALAEAEIEYRRAPLALHLRAVSGAGRTGPAGRGDADVVHHLDHDAVDPAGQLGHRRCTPTSTTSQVEVGRRALRPGRRASPPGRGEARLGASPGAGSLQGERARRGRSLATPSSTGRPRSSWRSTSRWSRAAAACTPRPATASRTTRSGSATALTSSLRWTAQGRFTEEAGKYAGLTLEEANRGHHSATWRPTGRSSCWKRSTTQYPHCWRCKNPVAFRATEQWFASVEGFREEALRRDRPGAVGPVLGRSTASATWWRSAATGASPGSGLGAYPCPSSTARRAASRCSTRRPSRPWPTCSGPRVPTPGTGGAPPRSCRRAPHAPSAAGASFARRTDIMDVWFDSGSSHAAVLESRPELRWPADMYLEGSRPAPRLVPVVASHRGGHPGRAAVPGGAHPRLHRRRRGAQDVQVAGERHRARRGDQEIRRRHPPAVGLVGRLPRRYPGLL